MDIRELIEANKLEFYQDLQKVMSIASVKGADEPGAPFGKEPRAVLEVVMNLAAEYGFYTNVVEDAVGYAQWGEDDSYIGVVGHLDVVPAGDGWSYPPFDLSLANGRFYGRGILDNKGPIMACLFGMKLLKEAGLVNRKTFRVIFGTDEECGSSDLPLYLKHQKAPIFGFTPDGKYPVVYGERGIVNYQIETAFSTDELALLGDFIGDQAKDHVPDALSLTVNGQVISVSGKRAPSNAPELGENAITLLAEKLTAEKLLTGKLLAYFTWLKDSLAEKHHGEGLGLAFEDADSGKLMITPYELIKTANGLALSVAIRYPISVTEEEVTNTLEKNLFADSHLKVVRRIKSTQFPKANKNVQKLSEVYEKATGLDGTPVTTTGATYARFMPNIVAFGPSFPGQKGIAHNKDEYMDEIDLLKNMEIYMAAIVALNQ